MKYCLVLSRLLQRYLVLVAGNRVWKTDLLRGQERFLLLLGVERTRCLLAFGLDTLSSGFARVLLRWIPGQLGQRVRMILGIMSYSWSSRRPNIPAEHLLDRQGRPLAYAPSGISQRHVTELLTRPFTFIQSPLGFRAFFPRPSSTCIPCSTPFAHTFAALRRSTP